MGKEEGEELVDKKNTIHGNGHTDWSELDADVISG